MGHYGASDTLPNSEWFPVEGDYIEIHLPAGVTRIGKVAYMSSHLIMLDEGFLYPVGYDTARVISIRKLGPDGD